MRLINCADIPVKTGRALRLFYVNTASSTEGGKTHPLLLWMKVDPGKSTTMMATGVIAKLSHRDEVKSSP